MTESYRVKYLRIALLVVGVIFIGGIYPLTILWPSGWSWNAGQSEYLQMILGIYATLGVFLVICISESPRAQKPDLVYRVVQHCARRNHGGTVAHQHAVHGAPLGRRAGTVCSRDCPCSVYTTRGGGSGLGESFTNLGGSITASGRTRYSRRSVPRYL
jgi:hypothetical protein